MNQLDFTEEVTQFADVILPIPIPRLYTYRVPREFTGQLQMGARVIVQFGKTKIVTALIARIHNQPPKQYQAKYILEVLDDTPLVTRWQLELFQWISDYYMCHIGEVMNVALPSGLKISSQSKVQYNPDFEHPDLLTPREKEIIEEIKAKQSLSYDELARFADVKNVYHLIKSLIGKRAVIVFEEVREKYTPKVVRKVRLTSFFADPENLKTLIGQLEKTPKQLDILLEYLRHVPALRDPEKNTEGLLKSTFSKNDELSDSSLDTLLKKGVFESFDIVISRFAEDTGTIATMPVLSDSQQRAVQEVTQSFQEKDTVLLHGVTGAGKTEVYIHLIEQALESGSQVLYLLPEIALTTQIVVRLKKIFGERVGIYHSKFSDNERVEVWKGVLSGRFQFVIGVRSAIFLPFDSLGLIIVDEEHEASYKQYDPAPRYHARDSALVIAKMQGAKVLLGSATPSIESYHHATQGRYGLVELKERFGNASLPSIELIDIRQARKNKAMKGDFSSELLFELGGNLERNEQTILFQNRRGYSPYLTCDDCGWIAKCDSCDVSLTYHQRDAELRCHYCGHKERLPKTCPACGSTKVRTQGFGTEKLEEDLQLHFPAARIQRMDLDTTRSKTAFQQMISDFEKGETDMLVGTQMVSKGLDFDKVSLVAIFDADRMINFPDFRATERSFQLLTQVSGRSGRRSGKQGRVLIQTNNTQHPLLAKIITNDYEGFYAEEIEERQSYAYPPFSRVIRLTTRHIEQQVAEAASKKLATLLMQKLGSDRVKGPETPLVERIRNQFLFDVLLKFERNLNLKAIKEFIKETIEEVVTLKDFKGVSIVIDVDPV
ncbi:primosomal protein N' [Siphonobacter sp. SORGH_AS_0500]|uniref:replication restart helicase PriA n=1 Tax=Siphonobacter sp. SORGH_AS_0500 TaxID=1864824 RepID=UPI0028554C9D|nr:primosomal protein N' [Siphonobacter sp. SORGH_AS_0500]MDR6196712.1 primosomal protein N' (replication factor Y) [Siphonobacter sp. SORGH_AS_0500]